MQIFGDIFLKKMQARQKQQAKLTDNVRVVVSKPGTRATAVLELFLFQPNQR